MRALLGYLRFKVENVDQNDISQIYISKKKKKVYIMQKEKD